MASFTETEGKVYRPFCSKSAWRLYNEIEQWADQDNLSFEVDALANIRIRSKNFDPSKKVFVVGSHVDTVIDAGKYDGPLGFLIGYEMLDFVERKRIELPFNLEVIGFSDEEGARYNTTYLGSSAVAGLFDDDWLHRKDADGITILEAMIKFECDDHKIKHCAIPKDQWVGYYEVHIEQGPVLQDCDLAVGLVKNIYGQIRINFEITGEAGHAGTVPMNMRKDAFAGLAEFMVFLERYGLERKDDLVVTIGRCNVGPGAPNVIPGVVTGTVDIRSHSNKIMEQAERDLNDRLHKMCDQRGLHLTWELMQQNPPVICAEQLNQALANSIDEHCEKVLSLPSGAGHDGVMISKVAPISMLFVRCKDGISHNPKEFCHPDDIAKALDVSLSFLQNLKHNYQNE